MHRARLSRGLNENQRHHQQGMAPVDVLEQVVQNQNQHDETGLVHQIAHDSEAVEQWRGRDVAGLRVFVCRMRGNPGLKAALA